MQSEIVRKYNNFARKNLYNEFILSNSKFLKENNVSY